jgi:hypothetical protein
VFCGFSILDETDNITYIHHKKLIREHYLDNTGHLRLQHSNRYHETNQIYSRYILKIEPKEFSNRLDVGYGQKITIKSLQSL